MEFEWNADLVYQIAENMEHVEECITIDSDISDDEEETNTDEYDSYQTRTGSNFILPFELNNEDSILPLSCEYGQNNSQVFDPTRIVDDSQEDPEIEVVFDSQILPPLIPLTMTGNRLDNPVKQHTEIPFQLSSQKSCFEDSQGSKYSKLVTDLRSLLECPVCSTIINTTPVHCCSNGHPTCQSCWTRCHLCPVCRVPCHSSPPCYAQTANTIISLIPLPCENNYKGCLVEGEEGMIRRHQVDCPFQEEEGIEVRGCQAFGCRVGH